MPIIPKDELKDFTEEEIETKLFELKNDLLRERSLIASGGASENPGRSRAIRKTIARLLTLQQEKKKEGARQ
jgi:large subunit ribosomal protein L29